MSKESSIQETQEMRVQSLGREDLLEQGMATHSSILAWRLHGQSVWWATVHGIAKNWTRLSTHPGTSASQLQS